MGMVQVILSEDVHALGDAGDIVSVKPGFARNYLIPQGKAMIATAERVNEVEHQKRVINEKLAKELSDLNAVKAKLHGMKLEAVAQAGEEGKLFGSVGTRDIAEALTAAGCDTDKSEVRLPDGAIRELGEYEIMIQLHAEVATTANIAIVAE